jgi:hypothetical protein
MVPAMMEELLFDDILFGERARDEHRRFKRVLQVLGVETLEASTLLAEALAGEPRRAGILEAGLQSCLPLLREEMRARPRSSSRPCWWGRPPRHGARGHRGAGPLRDPASPQLVLSARSRRWCWGRRWSPPPWPPRAPARGAAGAAVFRFHPDFSACPCCSSLGADRAHLEGGDVLVLSHEVIAVGTVPAHRPAPPSTAGAALASREGAPRWMLAVELPPRAPTCTSTPCSPPSTGTPAWASRPCLRGREGRAPRSSRWTCTRSEPSFVPCTDLLEALARHGARPGARPCGGADRWRSSGSSGPTAPTPWPWPRDDPALRPQRAHGGGAGRHGFRIVPADDLLLGRTEVDARGTRVCILLASHEISRARGGPHCLTHPLLRDRC